MDSWSKRLWRFKGRVFLTCGLSFGIFATSIPVQEYHASKGSVVEVSGDSTLHAYKIQVTRCGVSLKHSEADVWDLDVEIDVPGMQSGEKLMDKKIFAALKVEQFSKIRFQGPGKTVEKKEQEKILTFKGVLQVAGSAQEILLNASLKEESDGLHLRGNRDLFMTDCGVKPPTFMGLLKTDNKITVLFDIHLSSEQNTEKKA